MAKKSIYKKKKDFLAKGGKCWYTGLPIKILKDCNVDHLIPRDGGGGNFENLVFCHKDINSSMMNLPVWEKLDIKEKFSKKEIQISNLDYAPFFKVIKNHISERKVFGALIWDKNSIRFKSRKTNNPYVVDKFRKTHAILFWKHAIYMGEHRKRMQEYNEQSTG